MLKNISKNNLKKSFFVGLTTTLIMGGFFVIAPQAFAAIAQRGAAMSGTTTNTSLSVTKPTGVVSGDVLIVNIAQGGNNSTAPTSTGWTLIDGRSLAGGTRRYGAVLYKVAGGSEPASYTFTLGSGVDSVAGSIVAFSGVNTSGATPFDVAPGTILVSANGNTTAVGATTITTVSANAVVIMFGQAAGSAPTWNNGLDPFFKTPSL